LLLVPAVAGAVATTPTFFLSTLRLLVKATLLAVIMLALFI
jgi:hypothetical protein